MADGLEHEDYDILNILGEGTSGVAYKAKKRGTDMIVAIKQIKRTRYQDGVNGGALREVKLLQEIHHPNILTLIDVLAGQDSDIHLVMPMMDIELKDIIDSDNHLSDAIVKTFMKQTLAALDHIHGRWILHRDLKPENMLYSASEGCLKLMDFGLARYYGSVRQMSNQVVTIWYRSPELLYGAREYGVGVDIWAAGCMFGEMMLRKAMFRGENELDQLGKIFTVLGTPTKEDWPHACELSGYVEFAETKPIAWKDLDCFRSFPPSTLQLLEKMLVMNPTDRITAGQALQNEYFTATPKPLTNAQLSKSIVVEKVTTGTGTSEETTTTIKIQAA